MRLSAPCGAEVKGALQALLLVGGWRFPHQASGRNTACRDGGDTHSPQPEAVCHQGVHTMKTFRCTAVGEACRAKAEQEITDVGTRDPWTSHCPSVQGPLGCLASALPGAAKSCMQQFALHLLTFAAILVSETVHVSCLTSSTTCK